MAAALASRSTLRLSEVARHVVIPDGIVESNWYLIEDRLADMAIVFDRWQTNLGEIVLGLTADGKYAATVGGVTLSIPRQVGKTFTIGVLIVALCIEFPGLVVLWTAHHGRTTTKTFRSMQSIVKRKRIAPHLAPGGGIRVANGEQEIAFANGSIIMFGAREHGFGRGIDGVDVIVFDEAQILGEKALEDMVATTNQSRHVHGALLIYMGTPPRPDDNGEAFASKRTKALNGKMRNGVYVECSADPGADPDDQAQWAIANPSFPHHTPAEAMERMRENLPSIESWMLEAYGIWPDAVRRRLIMPKWAEASRIGEPATLGSLGIAMDPDRVWLSLAAASVGDVTHISPVLSKVTGRTMRVRVDLEQDVLLAEAARIVREHKVRLVIDPMDAGANLEDDLAELGVSVKKGNLFRAGFDDYVQSCSDLYDAIEATPPRATHGDCDELNAAVAAAGWSTGKRRVWKPVGGEISMLKAASLAKLGASLGPLKTRRAMSY